MNESKRTLLVGFDAACWEYLDPLLQAGRLPTLQHLMASGTWGTLRSTMPAITPVAWASISTGKNPGKHGVFDMTWRRPGTYDFLPTGASVRTGTPFWKRLNDHGLRVGLVNVPFTYPPEPLDGFVVCGFGSPGGATALTHPPDLLQELGGRFGDYRPAVEPEFMQTAPVAEVLAAERAHQALQVELTAELLTRHPVDVLVTNLMLLDHANHYAPRMDQVHDAICHTDADLGRLLDAFAPDTTMLISDHGSRRIKGNFLLFAWLRDRGYCAQLDRPASQRPAALNWVLQQWLQEGRGWSGPAERALRSLGRRAIPRLPRRLAGPLWRRIAAAVPFACEHVSLAEEIDYTRSRVFPGTPFSGALYLNLQGRDPMGMLSSTDRAALAEELTAGLAQILDPETGLPLFRGVLRSEDLYRGPAAGQAPDLVLDGYSARYGTLVTDYRHATPADQVGSRYFIQNQSRRDTGRHSRDGVFVFSGPAFARGAAPSPGHLVDVAPTLLYLCGVPIPEDYDGAVLTESHDPEFLTHRPLRYQPGDEASSPSEDTPYTKEEAGEIISHLRALGYVD